MLTKRRIDTRSDVKALKIVGILLISVGVLNLWINLSTVGTNNITLDIPYFLQIVCGFIIYFKCVGNAERASGYAGLCLSIEILFTITVLIPFIQSPFMIIGMPFSLTVTLLFRAISIISAIFLLVCSIICILEVAYSTSKILIFTSICVGSEFITYLWIFRMSAGIGFLLTTLLIYIPSMVMYLTFILIMTRKNVLPPTQFKRTKMNSEWLSTTSRIDSNTVIFREDLEKVLDESRKYWKPSRAPVESELNIRLFLERGFTDLLFLKYYGDDKMHMMVRIKDSSSFLDVFSTVITDYRMNGTLDKCSMIRFYGETGTYVDLRVISYGKHRGGFIETAVTRVRLKKMRAEMAKSQEY